MRRIADASADNPIPCVEDVEPGSVVHTDSWLAYDRLRARSCGHNNKRIVATGANRILIRHNSGSRPSALVGRKSWTVADSSHNERNIR